MREYLKAAAVVGCLIASIPDAVLGSNVAFDTAGDSAYNNGWTSGSNGGYGWGGGWNFADPSFGQFAGTATTAADGSQRGIINSPASTLGRAWELQDGIATRLLPPAPLPLQQSAVLLQFGETLSFDLDAPSGVFNVGIDARDHYSAIELISYGKGDYFFQDVPPDGRFSFPESTGIPVIDGPIHISISNNGPSDNYLFTASFSSLTPGAATSSYSFGVLAGLEEFYVASADSSDPIYLNNIAITPEPSAVCLAGLAGFGLLRRRGRRRLFPRARA